LGIRRSFVIIALLFLLTISYFPEALFLNSVLSFRDLGRYYYPLRLYTVNALKSGILPLWNPHISCGVPHLALQQSVVFYPLSLIYYLFPFDLAFNIFLITHIFLAGLFVYMLGMEWGWRISSSLMAAVTFMFSGYMISMTNLATTLSSVIWLPLAVLFFDRTLAAPSIRRMTLAAASLGVMFLGGEPSIFYSTLWVLLFYAVFRRGGKGFGSTGTAFFIFFIIAVSALALSAVQLIPFAELMGFADRTSGAAGFEDATKWSLPLKDTLNFLIPFIARTDFSKESYWREQNWVILIYVGVASALLLPLSFLIRDDRRVRFLYLTGIVSLLVAYGGFTPFYYLVYKLVPGFRFVRYPARFLYITTFAVSMLCGAGLQASLRLKDRDNRSFRKVSTMVLAAGYIAAILLLVLHLYKAGLTNWGLRHCSAHLDPKKDYAVLVTYLFGLENIKRFLGFFVTAGMVLWLGIKHRLREGVTAFALIGIVLIDLFTARSGFQVVLGAKTLREPTPNIAYLKKDKSIFRFLVSPKTRKADAFVEGNTYAEAVRTARDRLCANWPMVDLLQDAYGYDSVYLASYTKLMLLVNSVPSPGATRILDMLNVKYAAVAEKMDIPGYRLANTGAVYLYENLNALPRAYLADSFLVLKKDAEIADHLKSKDFDPRKEVILDKEPAPPPAESGAKARRPIRKERVWQGRAEIIGYSPNEVTVKVDIPSPQFLILSDSYYPGWKACIDGKRVEIYRANYILKAVYVGSGEHVVKFAFDPFSFKAGLAVSILALAVLLGLSLAPLYNRELSFREWKTHHTPL
jgi:type IV secretory pathway TrbD component